MATSAIMLGCVATATTSSACGKDAERGRDTVLGTHTCWTAGEPSKQRPRDPTTTITSRPQSDRQRALSRVRAATMTGPASARTAGGSCPLPARPGRDRASRRALDDTAGPLPRDGPRRPRRPGFGSASAIGPVSSRHRSTRFWRTRASRWSRFHRAALGRIASPSVLS